MYQLTLYSMREFQLEIKNNIEKSRKEGKTLHILMTYIQIIDEEIVSFKLENEKQSKLIIEKII